MSENKEESKVENNFGDLAVDGIFTGVQAGIVMMAFLLAVAVWQGLSPINIPAAFTFQGTPTLAAGIFTHLAVSSVYGISFNFIIHYLGLTRFLLNTRLVGLILGLVFGVILWLAAQYYLLDHAAVSLKGVPASLMLTAHLVYGVSLGLLIQRRQQSS